MAPRQTSRGSSPFISDADENQTDQHVAEMGEDLARVIWALQRDVFESAVVHHDAPVLHGVPSVLAVVSDGESVSAQRSTRAARQLEAVAATSGVTVRVCPCQLLPSVAVSSVGWRDRRRAKKT